MHGERKIIISFYANLKSTNSFLCVSAGVYLFMCVPVCVCAYVCKPEVNLRWHPPWYPKAESLIGTWHK